LTLLSSTFETTPPLTSRPMASLLISVIVPRFGEDISQAALDQHCRSLIAAYKCPKSYEFRTEPLPLTGAGKVRKYSLREPYWKDRRKRI
jgi:long-chain acyl-CoA synthetase